MKQPHIQRYLVTTRTGTREACCGPAILAMTGVTGYLRVGEARYGICCHTGPEVRLHALGVRDMERVGEWLERR